MACRVHGAEITQTAVFCTPENSRAYTCATVQLCSPGGQDKRVFSLGKIYPNIREIFPVFYSMQGKFLLLFGKDLLEVNYSSKTEVTLFLIFKKSFSNSSDENSLFQFYQCILPKFRFSLLEGRL
jgi:hypothetical protein